MTEQHHQFRDGVRLTWNVGRVIELARGLPTKEVALETIAELDSVYWFDQQHPPTCRAVVDHARRIEEADLARPIILSEHGLVMDGMHRVAKAFSLGKSTVEVVQFPKDPAPDLVNGKAGGATEPRDSLG